MKKRSVSIREASLDVAIVSGASLATWPSVGVRTLSGFCAEMGLSVGLFGGRKMKPRGVIPMQGTGGLLLAEDAQKQIHRIHAKALVRFSSSIRWPDPFEGWISPGLIPLPTAKKLREQVRISWSPGVVILGTGNNALRFGSQLIQDGVDEVYCVETRGEWDQKTFAGWEVERRQFEMLGGKLVFGTPQSLNRLSSMLWEFKINDSHGTRVIHTSRVISAGPFRDVPEVREYPPGSLLFEVEQTAPLNREDDFLGWVLEEERGRWLGGKISRTLATELGEKREELGRIYKRARSRLKSSEKFQSEPFEWKFEGKWTDKESKKILAQSEGVPKSAHRFREVASVECFEEIPCDLCQRVCPESAISQGRVLFESDCTACGLCLKACPSQSIALVQDDDSQSTARLTLSWKGQKGWQVGDQATLLNRQGNALGSGRVSDIQLSTTDATGLVHQLVQVEVPHHLVWEARAIKKRVNRSSELSEDEDFENFSYEFSQERELEKVEVTVNGDRRRAPEGKLVSYALFEMGRARSRDVLVCPDGSCGLCNVLIDGEKVPACQTRIKKGMDLKISQSPKSPESGDLCACQGIEKAEVIERIRNGKLKSPEAVISVTQVCKGKCRGQLCHGPFRQILIDEGIEAEQWIDWGFPWSEWTVQSR